MADARLGIGEPLVVLSAGSFATEEEARVVAAGRSFGDVQGFFVDEARHYRQLGRYQVVESTLQFIGDPGPFVAWPEDGWVVLTAFRTKAGAEELLGWVNAAELEIEAWQVLKVGGRYVGLGMEAHPDGSGALTGPLADQVLYQR